VSLTFVTHFSYRPKHFSFPSKYMTHIIIPHVGNTNKANPNNQPHISVFSNHQLSHSLLILNNFQHQCDRSIQLRRCYHITCKDVLKFFTCIQNFNFIPLSEIFPYNTNNSFQQIPSHRSIFIL